MSGGAALAAFLVALVAALVLTPVARRAAFALDVLDRPDRRLKRHREPVPYLGGAAIFLAVVSSVVAVKVAVGTGDWPGRMHGVVGLLAGSSVVCLLGLWDDFDPLTPRLKLLVQAAAAAIPIGLGVHIKFIENPWGAVPLTLLWLVGVTNALNLLDIKDGLCAGIAAIAAGWFWLISAQHGRMNDAIVAAAVAGAALGFLKYNRAPARIFMGDTGSLFLGFVLASVAIGQGYSQTTNLAVLAPVLILGVPVFETLFVMAVRRQQGKPMLQGSPDHIPIRLERMGYPMPRAVAILWAAGAGLGGVAYAVVQLNWERALLVCGAVGVLGMLAAIRLASVRVERG